MFVFFMALIRWINIPVTGVIVYSVSRVMVQYVRGDILQTALNVALIIAGFIWIIIIWIISKFLRNTIGRIPTIGKLF